MKNETGDALEIHETTVIHTHTTDRGSMFIDLLKTKTNRKLSNYLKKRLTKITYNKLLIEKK